MLRIKKLGSAILLGFVLPGMALMSALTANAATFEPLRHSRGTYLCLLRAPNALFDLRVRRRIPVRQAVRKAQRANKALNPISTGNTSRKLKTRAQLLALIKEIRDCAEGRGIFSVPAPDPSPSPTPPAATPTPTPTPVPLLGSDSVTVVRAFNYYYRDTSPTAEEELGSSLQLAAPLGQRSFGTFLYYAAFPRQVVEVTALDLRSDQGLVFPKENIHIGAVEEINQFRTVDTYLLNIWLRAYADDAADRRRVRDRVNADRSEAPMPFIIVPDINDYRAHAADPGAVITLPLREGARAPVAEGQRQQFWISAQVPEQMPLSEPTVFRGHLSLNVDGASLEVPIEVTVYPFSLDTLESHGKALSIYRAESEMPADLRETVLEDLRLHNMSSLVELSPSISQYQNYRDFGFDSVMTLGTPDDDVMSASASMGFSHLWYYTVDEPEYQGQPGLDRLAYLTNYFHSRGAEVGTAGSYPSMLLVEDRYPHEWFNLGFRLSWGGENDTMRFLEALRLDATRKNIPMLGHYSATTTERYNLLTRILYGPWLAESNLDFGCPYAYAPNLRENINPRTTTDWNGLAYPARFTSTDGASSVPGILSSQVWDALGDGGKMFRMVLMAKRLTQARGSSSDRQLLSALLEPYGALFRPGTRIDMWVTNRSLDQLQIDLLNLINRLK